MRTRYFARQTGVFGFVIRQDSDTGGALFGWKNCQVVKPPRHLFAIPTDYHQHWRVLINIPAGLFHRTGLNDFKTGISQHVGSNISDTGSGLGLDYNRLG
jgi:hypothetical protein